MNSTFVFCPLIDKEIENIDCIENREISDGNLKEDHLPEQYKQKENWRAVCKECKWHNY